MDEQQNLDNPVVEQEAKIQTQRHKKRIQIITLIAFAAVIAIGTIAAIPLIKAFKTEEGLKSLQTTLSRYNGIGGILIFTAIQALQVVIAVIPPVQIVGGLLFGWFWGGILSFVGTSLGTMLIFVIVHKFGRPIVEAFVDEKHFKKYKFLQDEKKLTLILIILYLIPGIPKDVISYIVPLTKISRKDFFCYVMPCRLPAIMLSTVLGSNVGSGNFHIALIVIGIALVVGVIGYLFKDVIVDKIKLRKRDK